MISKTMPTTGILLGSTTLFVLFFSTGPLRAKSVSEEYAEILKLRHGYTVKADEKEQLIVDEDDYSIALSLIPTPADREKIQLRSVIKPLKGSFKVDSSALPGLSEWLVFIDFFTFRHMSNQVIDAARKILSNRLKISLSSYDQFLRLFLDIQSKGFELSNEINSDNNRKYQAFFNNQPLKITMTIDEDYFVELEVLKGNKTIVTIEFVAKLIEQHNKNLLELAKSYSRYFRKYEAINLISGMYFEPGSKRSCHYLLSLEEMNEKITRSIATYAKGVPETISESCLKK